MNSGDWLDERMEPATIRFPRSVELKEAEAVLVYVAQNMPAEVNYKASYYAVSRRDKDLEVRIELGSAQIGGTIHKEGRAFDTFESYLHSFNGLIAGFRFNLIPGYELSEHRPEVRQLWDETRNVALRYFSEDSRVRKEILKRL
ncbi:hypothetical protein JW711_01875 [Candidatus Woesearchaeota archaeon]|nr:hypothetical protein [Candidatus Woesearchaeota archaeon]